MDDEELDIEELILANRISKSIEKKIKERFGEGEDG